MGSNPKIKVLEQKYLMLYNCHVESDKDQEEWEVLKVGQIQITTEQGYNTCGKNYDCKAWSGVKKCGKYDLVTYDKAQNPRKHWNILRIYSGSDGNGNSNILTF